MNPKMEIRSLRIEGRNESTTYSLSPGFNLILGGIGTGKTSLLRMVKYTLGGNAPRSAAVRDGIVSASLDLRLNGRRLMFRRSSDDRVVEVVDAQSEALMARCSASGTRVAGLPPVSDVLLEQLGLPQIELPRARRNPTSSMTAISFWDVFDYMYVRQADMDGAIVQHDNPMKDPRRRATFEVLYGITDADLARLERRRGELLTAISLLRKSTAAISAFLSDVNEPPENALLLERERLAVDIRLADEQLSALQAGARNTREVDTGTRARVLELESSLDSARRDTRASETEVAKLDQVSAQLTLALDRLERGEVGAEVLAPFGFRQCPRCFRSLVDRSPDQGLCLLCLQPEGDVVDASAVVAEHERLEAQLDETASLRTAEMARMAARSSDVAELERVLAEEHVRLDEETEGFVSQRFSEIEAAGRAIAGLHARTGAVERSIQLYQRLRGREDELQRMATEVRGVEFQIADASARSDEARGRVTRLSELFDDTLRQFGYPWYPPEGARIDPTTYLPLLASETFDEASGGMQTLLNVAYHLAGLRYGLQEGDSLLPLFLMLDSPRKNIGHLTDKEIGERIYRRFRTLHEAFPGQFQVLVADNDPPPLEHVFNIVELSYERPFVPWMRHPGPKHVVSLE